MSKKRRKAKAKANQVNNSVPTTLNTNSTNLLKTFEAYNQNNLQNITIPKTNQMTNMSTAGTMFGGYSKNYAGNYGGFGITFNMLRRISRRSGLITSVNSRRLYQFNRIAKRHKKDGDVGYRVVHENEYDRNFKVPEGFDNLCRTIENTMLRTPWREPTSLIEPTFTSFISKWILSVLEINRPAIELGLNAQRKPVSFALLDGANVYNTFDIIKNFYQTENNPKKGTILQRNSNQYDSLVQRYADKNRINLDSRDQYIYILQGRPLTSYTHDELLLHPMFPTDRWDEKGYPPSCLELALYFVAGEIMSVSYNMKYFQVGSMIDTILGFKGNFSDEDISFLKEIFEQNHTGVSGAHRLPLVNLKQQGDIQAVQLKQNRSDMSFGEFLTYLISGISSIYGVPPESLNMSSKARSDINGVFTADKSKEIELSREEGFLSCANHFSDTMDLILKRIDPDLCFEWQGVDNSAEDRRRKKILEDKDTLTIREIRRRRGDDDVPENMSDEDVDIIPNQVWLARKGASEAKEAQEKMAQQQQEQQSQSNDNEENNDWSDEDEDSFNQYLKDKK